MNARRFALMCVTVALLTSVLLAGEFPDAWTFDEGMPDARKAHAALEGKPMPALNLKNWINGEVKAEDLKGKVVLVDLYATWCGPCIAAIPKNNELAKKYKDKGLIVVGVCTSSGQEIMAEQAKKEGIAYSVGADPELKAEKDWGVHYYPTYAVVDRKGIVRVVGLQPARMEEVILKLLAEKAE